MKTLVWCILVVMVFEESAGQGFFKRIANLISSRSDHRGQDGYNFEYELDDGTKREEGGGFINGIWTVVSKTIWRDDKGNQHVRTLMADDKGVREEVDQPGETRLNKATLQSLLG